MKSKSLRLIPEKTILRNQFLKINSSFTRKKMTVRRLKKDSTLWKKTKKLQRKRNLLKFTILKFLRAHQKKSYLKEHMSLQLNQY